MSNETQLFWRIMQDLELLKALDGSTLDMDECISDLEMVARSAENPRLRERARQEIVKHLAGRLCRQLVQISGCYRVEVEATG